MDEKQIPDFLLMNIESSSDDRRKFLESQQLYDFWKIVRPNEPFNEEEARRLHREFAQKRLERLKAEADLKAKALESDRAKRLDVAEKRFGQKIVISIKNEEGIFVRKSMSAIFTKLLKNGETVTVPVKRLVQRFLDSLDALPDARRDMTAFDHALHDAYGKHETRIYDEESGENFDVRFEWKF